MSPRTGRPVRSRTATAKTSKGNTAKDVEARPRKAARKETTKATDATATGAVTAAAQQNKQSLSAAIIEQKNENTNIVSEATFITSSPRPVSRRKDLDKRSLKRAETESEQQDHDQDLLPLESNDENDAAQLVSFTDTVRTSNGAFALDENNVETVINDAGNQHETHMNDEAMEEILSAESITGTFYNEEAMGENGDARRQSIFQAIFSPAFKLLKKMPYGSLSDYVSSPSDQMQLEDNQSIDTEAMEDVVMASSTTFTNELSSTTTTTTTTATISNYTFATNYVSPLSVTTEAMVSSHMNQTLNMTNEVGTMMLTAQGQIEEEEEEEEEYTQDLELDDFDPYLFMATVPPVPKEYLTRPYALPRKTRSSPPITLVLDLDETLVHCSTSPIGEADLKFPVEFNGMLYEVHGRCRPHYREFLERVALMFEVVIFTASQKSYANRLLDIIDPARKLIKYRLFRDSCVHVCGNYLKDLSILGRDLSKVVIVDNAPQAFAYQLSNGIPIESWYEDPADKELLNVLQFLETLVGQEDVRPSVEQQFRTHDRIRHAQLQYG